MMWTSEMKWQCSNDKRKLVSLKLEENFLVVRLIEKVSTKQRTTSRAIAAKEFSVALMSDPKRQNKEYREIAEQVLLHFGLSYAEQNRIACEIRKFVAQIL